MSDHHMLSRRDLLRALLVAGATPLGGVPLANALGAADAPGRPDLSVIHGADAQAATRAAVETIGGISRFVSRGDVVFIKPNIGWARTPIQGANTHPDVVVALVALCLKAGAKVVKIADQTIENAERCYARSGILAAAREAGAQVVFADPAKFRVMKIGGEAIKEWPVYVEALEADKLLNVPIAKHHSLTQATLGMKNWFGLLGGNRSELHDRIHPVVADLARFFKPALIVMDGTRVLFRNGPQGGSLADVRKADTVAASTDQVAIDAFGATLLDLAPSDVGYVRIAHERRLGSMKLDALRVVRRSL